MRRSASSGQSLDAGRNGDSNGRAGGSDDTADARGQDTTGAASATAATKGRPRRASSWTGFEPVPASAVLKVLTGIVVVGGAVIYAASAAFPDSNIAWKLWGVTGALLGIGAVDLVAARFSPARWWVLHAFANAVVVIGGFPDFLSAFYDPVNSLNGSCSLIPAFWVPAIHVYHTLAFDLDMGDIVHHALFAGIICPVGLIFETGVLQNAVGFFISGLPGGLDYVMLALVKHGVMSPFDEKKWNARINVWIRAPGLTLCAAWIWVAWEKGVNETGLNPVVLGLVALLCILNGQYYLQVVVGNTFVRTRQTQEVESYNS